MSALPTNEENDFDSTLQAFAVSRYELGVIEKAGNNLAGLGTGSEVRQAQEQFTDTMRGCARLLSTVYADELKAAHQEGRVSPEIMAAIVDASKLTIGFASDKPVPIPHGVSIKQKTPLENLIGTAETPNPKK